VGDDEADKLDTAVSAQMSSLQGRPNARWWRFAAAGSGTFGDGEKEAAELLASYGLKEPGLNRLIRATYWILHGTDQLFHGDQAVQPWLLQSIRRQQLAASFSSISESSASSRPQIATTAAFGRPCTNSICAAPLPCPACRFVVSHVQHIQHGRADKNKIHQSTSFFWRQLQLAQRLLRLDVRLALFQRRLLNLQNRSRFFFKSLSDAPAAA